MIDKEMVLEINGREYTVVVNDFSSTEATVSVDGKRYTVGLKDLGAEQVARIKPQVQEQPGTMAKSTTVPVMSRPRQLNDSNMVAAPLPGQIVKIFVKEGDTIEIGQKVCILEAMKMENEVNATAAGIIVDIRYKEGESVNQGDPLLILKPAEG